jgi:hypothetical protein
MSQIKIVEKRRSRALRPLLGLILALALGVISFVLAPSVVTWLQSQNRRFGATLEPQVLQLLVAAAIFGVLLTIFALLVAAATPKKMIDVKDTDLMKERKQNQMHKEYERKRQRQLNRKLRENIQARTDVNRERFGDKN